MNGFIDKLADFLRSLFDDGGERQQAGSPRETHYVDPDLQDAWNELNEHMGSGRTEGRAGRSEGAGSARAARSLDESLRQDYVNLEVPFGADMETVRRSYKGLMLKYHPDKHAGDPQKQRIALEITKKVNQSFERIRSGHEAGRRSS